MKCLRCGLEIENPSEQEKKDNWHRHCVRGFFGTDELPFIEITEVELEAIAAENAKRGLTIPGVQKKLSLHHESGNGKQNRLTLVDYPTGYILKPQTAHYKNLPEAEFLAMQISEKMGVRTVLYALIKLKDSLGYITKRIDRTQKLSNGDLERFAMEDFCQLSERLSEDKYSGSYEACARIIKKYSTKPGLDLAELFVRVVSGFIVGNADLHLKNLSLIEDKPGSRVFSLSAAYDILPVNIVDAEDTEELALSLNGKKKGLTRNDFLTFAEYCGLGSAGEKMINRLIAEGDLYISLCKESLLPSETQEKMAELIRGRIERLRAE